MSSWIPSLFNPSRDDDNPASPTPRSPSSGVKEDLSTVFRGVAAFLAPPPSSSSSSDAISGIKNDLAEIQGSFRSGLSLISSKFTSNFLQFDKEENDVVDDDEVSEEGDVVGIDEEVVDFVRKISGRPELWTDFPLSLQDDFNLSDYQREHAASIDELVPELVIMRHKFCSHMRDEQFWLIYFILLLPRLNEVDMELLSTPEIIEARQTLLKKFQKKTDETSKEGGQSTAQTKNCLVETENSSKEGDLVSQTQSGHHSEEVVIASKRSENSEFSFSELEDEESDLPGQESDRSQDWIQHNESYGVEGSKQKVGKSGLRGKESEGEDSNEWLTVDGTDFDNLADT